MSPCALTLPKVVLGKQIIAAASDRVKGSKQKWDKDQTGDGIVQKEGHKPISQTEQGRGEVLKLMPLMVEEDADNR